MRMEFLSRNPDIVQIYDAFSEKEVAEIVNRGEEPKPSVIVDFKHNLGPQDTMESRMNRKIEVMTGLQSTQVSGVEQAPVINSYVPGGHAEFHVDSVSSLYN